jgi:hypothetical protein
LKLFVIAVSLAAIWAAPAAAGQDVPTPTPDPAPGPAQPTPDPVPQPGPASSAPTEPAPVSDVPAPPPAAPAPPPASASPPVEQAPAEPAPTAPSPAPAASASTDPPAQAAPPPRSSRDANRKPKKAAPRQGKEREKAKPMPVFSEVGPFVEGMRARAAAAARPIAIVAGALLVLSLTSGGFLLVAARRSGAWRT